MDLSKEYSSAIVTFSFLMIGGYCSLKMHQSINRLRILVSALVPVPVVVVKV